MPKRRKPSYDWREDITVRTSRVVEARRKAAERAIMLAFKRAMRAKRRERPERPERGERTTTPRVPSGTVGRPFSFTRAELAAVRTGLKTGALSVTRIAALINKSPSTVYDYIHRMGLKPNGRKQTRIKLTYAEVVQYYMQGMRVREIAAMAACTTVNIYKIVNQYRKAHSDGQG